MDVYVENLLELWHSATITDYGYLVLVVCGIAWLTARWDR